MMDMEERKVVAQAQVKDGPPKAINLSVRLCMMTREICYASTTWTKGIAGVDSLRGGAGSPIARTGEPERSFRSRRPEKVLSDRRRGKAKVRRA